MKKGFILPLTFFLFLCSFTFVACTTMTPFSGGSNSVSVTLESRPYKVLGDVSYEGSTKILFGIFVWGGASYSGLLEKAREQYEGCDAVLNVTVDTEVVGFALIWQTIKYKMTGTAVKFIEKSEE